MKCSLLLAVVAASVGSWSVAQTPPPHTGTPAAAPQAAASAPDLAAAKARVTQVCAACHGVDGNSAIPINPSLAGMPPEYITQQLSNFKAGIRVSPVMLPMATPLSPDEMRALGLYFAQQKPKAQAAKDAALVQAGQKLYRGGDLAQGVPACASCHAPDGSGIAKRFPRLAGQHGDYTLAQLKAFKSGERGNDKDGKDVNGRIMAVIAAKLSETQMQALAQYTQGLR